MLVRVRFLTLSHVSSTMTHVTPTQQLVELRLGGDLPGFLARKRATEPPTSWRNIATEITERTGLPVSYEAVRTWSRDLAESAA